MSAAKRSVPRLQALFVTAFLGVLAAIGLALSALGWPVVVAYSVVVVLVLGLLAQRARSRQPTDGKTCNCCTSTVFDPVEVR